MLLYAQPLVRIATLKTTAVDVTDDAVRISLGADPAPVPIPFAEMLIDHLHNRTNLRTGAAMASNPWLFPGRNAGKHLDPQTMQMRLNDRGISVLGARNSALQNLVAEIPAAVVANLLGYSHTSTQYHAQLAAQPWARYVTSRSRRRHDAPTGRRIRPSRIRRFTGKCLHIAADESRGAPSRRRR